MKVRPSVETTFNRCGQPQRCVVGNEAACARFDPLEPARIGGAPHSYNDFGEAAFVLRPVDGLSINGNVAYTDATFRNATSIAPAGSRLPSSAKWAGQVGFEYQFDLASDWKPFVGASYRYVGKRQGEFAEAIGAPRDVLPSYGTVDLRAGAEYQGFEVTAFVRNVTDKYGVSGLFNFGPYKSLSLIQPRTFGVSLAKSF